MHCAACLRKEIAQGLSRGHQLQPLWRSERLAIVVISSENPGADIEIDGAFVGSTPTTIRLTAGIHKISVKSGGKVWERDLQVSAGAAINLKASFTN